jgi:hypothetical protein
MIRTEAQKAFGYKSVTIFHEVLFWSFVHHSLLCYIQYTLKIVLYEIREYVVCYRLTITAFNTHEF